jgi:hypothetical protein
MSNERATLEEPLEFTGRGGKVRRCDRLSPRAFRQLESWMRRRRLRDFAAEKDAFNLNVIEQAEVVAAIMRDEVATSESEATFRLQESAQLYVLWRLMQPHDPGLGESMVEREFGDRLPEIISELRAASLPQQQEAADGDKKKEASDDGAPDPQSSAAKSAK